MKLNSIILVFVLFISQFSLAQTSMTQSGDFINTRRGIATVILFGFGGAVLGLSTLSFYGRPQENLANISYGFGLGLIVGGFYVANQASEAEREKISLDPVKELMQRHPQPQSNVFAYQWSF